MSLNDDFSERFYRSAERVELRHAAECRAHGLDIQAWKHDAMARRYSDARAKMLARAQREWRNEE